MLSHTSRAAVRASLRLAPLLALAAIVAYLVRFRPVTVGVAEARRGSVRNEVLGTGTLEARTAATISPKISGRLSQVLADQNDRVRAGQLLAVLDDGELRQQAEVAKADLAAMRASVERSQAELTALGPHGTGADRDRTTADVADVGSGRTTGI